MLENIRIVLVEPSHPGNIGGAARALKTMGLRHLVVVNPLRYPDPQAQWRAAGAQDVLAATRVCTSLAQAIGDCRFVVGTSTRQRRIPWPVDSVAAVAAQVLAVPSDAPVAILFGREANGLSNEELQLCHQHLQIPANPEYPSLNLAMAVQVVCYELFKQSDAAPAVDQRWDRPRATQAALDDLVNHFERLMLASGFVDPASPGQTVTRLRRLLTRVHPDETETALLRGLLTALERGFPDNSGPN